jgi:hypothetical protein
MRHRLLALTVGCMLAIGLAAPAYAAAPVAQSDLRAILEGGSTTLDVLANDYDPDGDALTIQSFTQPIGGSVVRAANPRALVITPVADFSGYLEFEYTVSDAAGGSATATVVVNVDPVDDAPVATDVSEIGGFRVQVHVSLEASDWETCELSFVILGAPNHGKLSGLTGDACVAGGPDDPGLLTPNTDSASIVYTPKPGFTGTDTFTYAVSDGTNVSAPATVTVSVAKLKLKGHKVAVASVVRTGR